MSRFLNERYAGFEAYVPGEQPKDLQYLKLNTNESPYPPSDKVLSAVKDARSLQLYPALGCGALRAKLARLYDVGEDNVFLGNGSDEVLSFAFAAFGSEKTPPAFPAISYGFYPVYANYYALPYEAIPLCDDFSIDPEDYCNLNSFIVIANPNAPTGRLLSLSELERIMKSNPDHVVLIDEAYIDFGGESCRPLTKKYDNLLVVGTFSKSRSMAGARLGFAIGDRALIEDLEKLQYSSNPYNVNSLTQAAAEAAIDDNAYFMDNCRRIITTRSTFTAGLQALGFEVVPSEANFVLARSNTICGKELYLKLKEKGILVRHFDADRLKDYNRITIGTDKDMVRLLDTIKQLLEECAHEKQ